MGFPGFDFPARMAPAWKSLPHYQRYAEARGKWVLWSQRAAELRAKVTWGGSASPACDWHSAWWCLVVADGYRLEMERYYREGGNEP